MLKKIFKKPALDSKENIFPNPVQEKLQVVDKILLESDNTAEYLSNQTYGSLVDNKNFIEEISESVTQRILNILLEKYDFTPTDKYLQQQMEKKQYIRQLDAYLEERKKTNTIVNNDLQEFLRNTTELLSQKLEHFSQTIKQTVTEAEQKHGIDKLKSLLNDDVPKG